MMTQQIKSTIKSIQKQSSQSIIEEVGIKKLIISRFSPLEYSFYRYSKTIFLEDNNTTATQGSFYYQNQKIILTQPIVSNNAQAIFKVQSIKYCIGFGVAIQEVIQKHDFDYKSQGNELGHGLYIVTSQGYSWSHSEKEEDDIFRDGFNMLYTGAKVHVTYYGEKLTFRWKKGQFTLTIRSELAKKYKLAFCAYLHEKGDSITLLEN